jgi:hypothetical protein
VSGEFFARLDLGQKLQRYALPAARPEFRNVTAAEAWAAVAWSRGDSVELEVARLAIGYLAAFQRHAARLDGAPDVLQVGARWPVERVALLLVVEFIEAQGGAARPVGVH